MRYLVLLLLLSCSTAKKEKHDNEKHPSYKYYDKVDGVIYDNSLKNKRDLKKVNKKKKIKPEKSQEKQNENFKFY